MMFALYAAMHVVFFFGAVGHHLKPHKPTPCEGTMVTDASFTVNGVPTPYCREPDTMILSGKGKP